MNVRGLRDSKKRNDVFQYIRQKKVSVCCLQDFHCTMSDEDLYEREWKGTAVFSSYTSNSRGVAILFSNELGVKIHGTCKDEGGNYIVLDVEIDDLRITLVNVYGPNEDLPDFYKKLGKCMNSLDNATIIACGDWNMVLNQEMDTKNYLRENNVKAKRVVMEMCETMELSDPWRSLHESRKRYTWRQYNPVKMARLDFFLVTNDILNNVLACDILPSYKSDHSAIVLDIMLSDSQRGKGYWKFNKSLLYEVEYIKLVQNCIQENIRRYALEGQDSNSPEVKLSINDQLFFEVLKMEIRGQSIRYGSRRKCVITEKKKELECKIKLLEEELEINVNEQKLAEYNMLKKDLSKIREQELEGVMLRAKCKWHEQGEKPTKYFCSLLKRNYENKVISQLIVNGERITKQEEILKKEKEYYEDLYKSRSTQQSGLFLNDNLPQLDEEQSNLCEGLITDTEVKSVLKQMSNNKTPGIDGYTAEFYKFFWKDIGIFLVRSINYAYKHGQMSDYQRLGVITLLPKGDKSRLHLKNWRPISLLCIDYKLLSSVLAMRVKKVLPNLIGTQQQGFQKNKFIGDNTRLVYDVMYYLSQHNKPGLLLLIDFEKAFDCLERSFMFQCLKQYNFGKGFIKWVSVLYKNCKSMILNNGWLSEQFDVCRGCRQGDPLSPYLFILSVEPLAQRIIKSREVLGVNVNNTQIVIGQYADDTFLILDGTEKSLRNVIMILEEFEAECGLKINVDKTCAVWLGSKVNDPPICQELNIQWVKEFRLLGIDFKVNLHEMEDNFLYMLSAMEKVLKEYGKRNLTLMGKVTVINSLALPKIVHAISILPNPKECIVDRIKKMYNDFLWNQKKAKISKCELYKKLENGGLKLRDPEAFMKALKITWVKRLMTTEGGWQALAQDVKKMIELDATSLKLYALKIKNPFWKSVLESWIEYYGCCNLEKDVQDVLKIPLWNTYFTVQKNIQVLGKKLDRNGCKRVGDLIDEHSLTFYNLDAFVNRYNVKLNYLDYITLKGSIPMHYKNTLKNITLGDWLCSLDEGRTHISELLEATKTCNMVYWKIVEQTVNVHKPSYMEKWSNELKCTIEEKSWRNFFMLPYNTCIDTKMRMFQWNIMHRLLITNKKLCLFGIANSNMCTFCDCEEETISHLFYECKYVKELWTKLFHWLYPNILLQKEISSKETVFGFIGCGDNQLANLMLILCKRYIYVKRCYKQPLEFSNLIRFITDYYKKELMLCKQDGNYGEKIEKKWSVLLSKIREVG